MEFDDGKIKGNNKWFDDDAKLMAKLTPGLKKRRSFAVSFILFSLYLHVFVTHFDTCLQIGSRSSAAPTLAVEDVSQEMLSMITYSCTHKVYSIEHGTSCHQCRYVPFFPNQ